MCGSDKQKLVRPSEQAQAANENKKANQTIKFPHPKDEFRNKFALKHCFKMTFKW